MLLPDEVKIKDIMTRDVKTIPPEITVAEAARLLTEFHIDSLIVLSDDNPIGIITGGDIIKKVVGKSRDATRVKVAEVMSKPLTTISPGENVEKAASLMVKEGIKKLPVLQDDRIVGILTTSDIAKHYPQVANKVRSLLESSSRRLTFWDWYTRKG